ncbi:hypothetical protein, partial [Escherichia coli]|uniref:hypothetical protein n=1 Tax=Escherichia coli TaxID=562 RepID=UPI00137B320B
ALAKRMDVADRVIVTTNASLLDERAAGRILDSGLDFLRVSVYGATAERMRALTGTQVPLERVVANVARLKAMRDGRGAAGTHIYAKMIEPGDEAERRRFLDTFTPICDEAAIEPAMNWNVAQDEIDFSGGAPSTPRAT